MKVIRVSTINIIRALRLVWVSSPRWAAVSLILVILQGILPVIALYVLKLILDILVASLSSGSRDFGPVLGIIIVAGVISVINAIVSTLASLSNEAQSHIITDYIADLIHSHSITLDLEYYENSQYYDRLHQAQQQTTYRPPRILNSLKQIAVNGISLLGIIGLIASLHWLIAVIMLLAVIPGAVLRLRYAGQVFTWQRVNTVTERLTSYFDWLLVSDAFAKEIRLFNLGPLFIERFHELRRLLRGERIQLMTKNVLAELATQVGGALAIFGTYAFVAYRVLQSLITFGDLVMFYQAFQRGQAFLQEIMRSLAILYEDSLFLTHLFDFLALKPNIAAPAAPSPVPTPITDAIRFEHVSFAYPGSSRVVLSDISLEVRPGEVIALVGENGEGKTTLIKLLCRLYDPTSGSIHIDGVDLRQFDPVELRRHISVIFQDYAHYNLTAQENIWFGNGEQPLDLDKIKDAARISGADAVINALPAGYETTLGKLFQDGEELSVGQWQKIAIARAFLRKGQIMVLDEPTSALDAKAEYEVFLNFRQLIENQAAVLISHRMSTVRMADRIYVLQGGRIAEAGTHHELMALNGQYATLFNIQARSYQA